MTENGRVALRDYIEQRFDGLERRIDACLMDAKEERQDHEQRLRALEKREPWRNAIEAILGLLAAIAAALGFTSQP